LTCASLAGFVLSVFAVYALFPEMGAIGTQCCASILAVFVYATARYRTRISEFVSKPLLVRLGEASYSLYLLHFYLLHEIAKPYGVRHAAVPRAAIYLVAMIAALVVARISYLFFERSAIRWVRANFRPLRFDLYLPTFFALITAFSLLLSIHMRA